MELLRGKSRAEEGDRALLAVHTGLVSPKESEARERELARLHAGSNL